MSVTKPKRLRFPGTLSWRAIVITRDVVPIKVPPKPRLLMISKRGESLARVSSTQIACTSKFAVRQGKAHQRFAAHSQPKQPGTIDKPTNVQRWAVNNGEPASFAMSGR